MEYVVAEVLERYASLLSHHQMRAIRMPLVRKATPPGAKSALLLALRFAGVKIVSDSIQLPCVCMRVELRTSELDIRDAARSAHFTKERETDGYSTVARARSSGIKEYAPRERSAKRR